MKKMRRQISPVLLFLCIIAMLVAAGALFITNYLSDPSVDDVLPIAISTPLLEEIVEDDPQALAAPEIEVSSAVVLGSAGIVVVFLSVVGLAADSLAPRK